MNSCYDDKNKNAYWNAYFRSNVSLPGVTVKLIFAGFPDDTKGHGYTATLAVSLCGPESKFGNMVTFAGISGTVNIAQYWISVVTSDILIPRGRAPFSQHQESRPPERANTLSLRFTDFPSLCAWSESSLVNLIGWEYGTITLRMLRKLDLPRVRDSWSWPIGAGLLVTRMSRCNTYYLVRTSDDPFCKQCKEVCFIQPNTTCFTNIPYICRIFKCHTAKKFFFRFWYFYNI